MGYIKKFKNYLKESISSDNELNIKANLFYKDLYNYLNDNKPLEQLGEGSFYLDVGKLDDKYSDLVVIFTYPNSDILKGFDLGDSNYSLDYCYGSLEYKKWEHVIICSNLIDKFKLDYIGTRLNKNIFIHEFIHYLDFKYKIKKKLGKNRYKNINNYFNDSLEYNAYYMSGFNTLDSMFSGEYKLVIWDKYGSNFEKFKEFSKKSFDIEWLKNMNYNTQKKFNKRLYSLYINLKNKNDNK